MIMRHFLNIMVETGRRHWSIKGLAVEPGGPPELLERLAVRYMGPGVEFPPPHIRQPGHRIRPKRLGGVGPWASRLRR
jgi:hypothetical protein